MNNGGPAFPQPVDDLGTLRAVNEGMSLRDWFAGQIIAGLLARQMHVDNLHSLAEYSYKLADAMVGVRENADS